MANYRGYEITFGQRFGVAFKGEMERKDASFDTYNAATKAIDEHVKAMAKDRKVALDVIVCTVEGLHGVPSVSDGVVTGINLHTRALTGLGKHDRAPEVFPREQWIRDALAERQRLRTAIEELNDKLQDVCIGYSYRTVNGHSYPNISVDNYDDAIAYLEAEYATKCALAAELGEASS